MMVQMAHSIEIPIDIGEILKQAMALTTQVEGANAILRERIRQVQVEGWTPEHDDDHTDCELNKAATCYAVYAAWQVWYGEQGEDLPEEFTDSYDPSWPFETAAWKPSPDPIRNLEKAGALIAAEIDRLRRMQK